jgi:flagellar hook-associated protein 2
MSIIPYLWKGYTKMLDTNTQIRLTGMASGLDTDAIIQQLGKAHMMRVDAVKRDKTYALWKQESLRNVIGMISNFQKSSFSTLNPLGNFRSANAFAKFSFDLTVGNSRSAESKEAASRVLSVTANGDLKNFNQSVQAVTQLASKDTWNGNAMGLRDIKTDGFDFSKFVEDTGVNKDLDNSGVEKPVYIFNSSIASISLSVDGITRNVTIGADKLWAIANEAYGEDPGRDLAEGREKAADLFAKALDEEITKQFGKDYKGLVSLKGGELVFSKSGSNITINNPDGVQTLKTLGLDNGGVSNGNVAGKKLSEVLGSDFFSSGSRALNINGTSILIDADDTVSTLMSKINSSKAGVELYYSSASDTFTLKSKSEGTASNIQDVTGAAAQLFGKLGLGETVVIAKTYSANGVTNTVTDYKLSVGGAAVKLESNEAILLGREYSAKDEADNDVEYNMYMKQDKVTGKYEIVTRPKDGGPEDDVKIGDVDENGDVDWNWSGVSHVPYDTLGITTDPTEYRNSIQSRAGDFVIRYTGNDSESAIGSRTEGTNLIAMINGETFTRQSNSFHYEGMTYTFHETFNTDKAEYDEVTQKIKYTGTASDELKINVGKDTAAIKESILAFVEEYNKIVEHINGLITEKRDKDYKPLSDDEKAAMKEEDIKKYEEKARQGVLANDPELRKLLDKMRSTIYQKVEGVGLTMADIGISTGAYSWQDGGKLVITDTGMTKLEDAIENRYEEVVALFSKAPDKDGNGGGIAHKLNSVFNDAVEPMGENKGYLLRRAGIPGNSTAMDNAIQKQLDSYDKRIATLLERWYRQESMYLRQFSRMETAMSKMTAQQNSLAGLMAQNSGG